MRERRLALVRQRSLSRLLDREACPWAELGRDAARLQGVYQRLSQAGAHWLREAGLMESGLSEAARLTCLRAKRLCGGLQGQLHAVRLPRSVGCRSRWTEPHRGTTRVAEARTKLASLLQKSTEVRSGGLHALWICFLSRSNGKLTCACMPAALSCARSRKAGDQELAQPLDDASKQYRTGCQ